MKTLPPQAPPPHLPSQWSWHYRQLQSLRDRLLDSRATHLAEGAEPSKPPGIDMADSATDSFDHDLALGLLSYEQDALCEIDAALQRIQNGTYGLCEETAQPIPAARLEAVPWTRYTKDVEARLERAERAGPLRQASLGPVHPLEEPEKALISALDAEEPESRFGTPLGQPQSDVDLEAVLLHPRPQAPSLP